MSGTPGAGRAGASRASWRSLVLPALATVVVTAILVSLGVWQVHRLAWKEALIAQVTAGLSAQPVPAPGPEDWPTLAVSDHEYERVEVSGTFFDDQSAYVVYALTEPKGKYGGGGYLVMTPLQTTGGWTVYVNRGFVPGNRRNPATRPGSTIPGVTTVIGLLRTPYQRAWFAPGDDARNNAWFSRDPALYAAAYGAPTDAVAPYIIDANFDPALPDGLPQGGETIVSFPNSHLGYAITWFGLAIASMGVFVVFAVRRLGGTRAGGGEEPSGG